MECVLNRDDELIDWAMASYTRISSQKLPNIMRDGFSAKSERKGEAYRLMGAYLRFVQPCALSKIHWKFACA